MIKIKTNKYSTQQFIQSLLSYSQEPVAIIGLANLMGVKIRVNENKEEFKNAENILIDMIETFDKFDRDKRKRILKIMNGSFKTKGSGKNSK